MSKSDSGAPDEGQILLYTGPNGKIRVDVAFRGETAWLTQKALAALFGVKVPAITKHLKNIFASGELAESAVVSVLETTAADGKRYATRWYSLDAIIAVGYRVNSFEATQFRIWATRVLRELLIKGFVLDDERLQLAWGMTGTGFFDESHEQIRIRRSCERSDHHQRPHRHALAIDYDSSAPVTKDFFASVQNKLHWAITGKTAAELIYAQADATKLFMGLSTWAHAPDGKVLKSDVTVAKNYLSAEHVKELNRIVSAYLDLAENRAERGIPMKMQDWAAFLNSFLELSNYPILEDAGSVSALQAKLKAEAEYEVYRLRQDAEYVSDFDKEVKRLEGGKP